MKKNVLTSYFSESNAFSKTGKIISLLIYALIINISVFAASSDLDPTFGNGGKVVSSPAGMPIFNAVGMALQPDGKIVVAGNKIQSGAYAGIIVVRYNADGSLDTNFGNNGWNSVTFGLENTQYEIASAVDIFPDGKIIVGGTNQYRVGNSVNRDFIIAAFNSDGILDSSFDGDGKLIISFNDILPSFYTENLSVVKAGSDGKIIVGGVAIDSSVADRFIFAKIKTDGSLDTSFGTNGKFADQSLGASNLDKLNDIVILPDGKFVVAGKLLNILGSFRIAVKYNINGGREWTYSQGVQGTFSETEAFNGIAVQLDGKFILVGKQAGKIVAYRFNADGTVDSSFTNPTSMPNGEALKVALQPDGKIVATISSSKFSLIRYNTNGSLDTSFGDSGFLNTSLTNGGDYSAEILIQSDGKYLVGGTSVVGSPTEYYISMARYKGTAFFPGNPPFDYDGDGKSDISIFRPSTNVWYLLQSTSGVFASQFGNSQDKTASADYDGDGKTDIAIFRPSSGAWWYLSSADNTQHSVQFGADGDIPRPSDFDGDGIDDFIVYRPSTSVWYRFGSQGGTSTTVFGTSGDKPLIGDFNGDGKSDLTIYRPSTGTWWWKNSVDNIFYATQWGNSTDIPAPADYDGDGKTDFAVYRPSEGIWYIFNSSNGQATIVRFGLAEDKPVPADYDGDGKSDIAVFRPSTGVWYLLKSTEGFAGFQFGLSTDIPIPNSFIQ